MQLRFPGIGGAPRLAQPLLWLAVPALTLQTVAAKPGPVAAADGDAAPPLLGEALAIPAPLPLASRVA